MKINESVISKRTEKVIEKGHLDENEEEKQQIIVGQAGSSSIDILSGGNRDRKNRGDTTASTQKVIYLLTGTSNKDKQTT